MGTGRGGGPWAALNAVLGSPPQGERLRERSGSGAARGAGPMSGRQEEALPACFAGLGAGSPRPRQKRGGMFCSVEDAFDNKTLNFASLAASGTATPVGGHRRDTHPTPNPGPSPDAAPSPDPDPDHGPAAAALPPRAAAPAALPDGCRQVTGLRRDRDRERLREPARPRPRREGERGDPSG